jgi:uncharacterized protein YkwD
MLRILLVLVALTIPSGALAYSAPHIDYWRIYTLYLINVSRLQEGLPTVGLDFELNELAQAHAQDTAMHFDDETHESRRATYLKHISSDGRELGDRVREHGIQNWLSVGENVGFRWKRPFSEVMTVVQESLHTLHDGMMAEVPPDDGHRKTILGDYTHIGVGIELHKPAGEETNSVFYVTNFAKFTGKGITIPDLPAPPLWTPPETETEEVSVQVLRRRREQLIPLMERTTKRGTAETEEGIPQKSSKEPEHQPEPAPAPLSWVERTRQRVENRRSDRLQRLMEKVGARRMKRLERREM